MTKPRLLIVEPRGFSPEAASLLNQHFDVSRGPLDRKGLLQAAAEQDALLVRLAHQLDAEVLANAPSLRVIASPTTGLNHIDLTEAARRNVTVLSLRGERAFLDTIHPTAELSWGLLLALIRRIPAACRSVEEGRWDRDSFRGGELHGRTLGIVGLGRLGSMVAGYGRAFGMSVLACDPRVKPPDGVLLTSLDELFERSDVISIHASLEPDSHGLIGAVQFSRARPGALLVNTARGEILHEGDLLTALQTGQLAGAALDVLCFENADTDSSLALIDYARTHDNLLITPHIGGASDDAMARTELFVARKLIKWMKLS